MQYYCFSIMYMHSVFKLNHLILTSLVDGGDELKNAFLQ